MHARIRRHFTIFTTIALAFLALMLAFGFAMPTAQAEEAGDDAPRFTLSAQGDTQLGTQAVSPNDSDGFIAALQNGEDITLDKNLTVNPDGWTEVASSATKPATVTLDLNGHTLTNEAGGSLFVVGNGITLIVKDGASGGTITGSTKDRLFEVKDTGALEIQSGTFSGNEKAVIWANGNSTVKITGGTFSGNRSRAIEAYGDSKISITGATFSGNAAGSETEPQNGGAILAEGNSTLNIADGTTFKSNFASNQGGAICVNSATATFSGNVIIDGNTARGNGGGMHVQDTDITLPEGVTISNNTAGSTENPANGGGIHIWNATVNLNGATVSGNKAIGDSSIPKDGAGGGIAVNGGSTLTFTQGSVKGNTSDNDHWGHGGGGIVVYGGCTLDFSGGSVEGNFATGSGGGIILQGGILKMTGGTIDGNIARLHEGGGIAIISGSGTIDRGRIVNNKSGYNFDGTPNPEYQDWGGGGVFISDQGDPTASLTIKSVTVKDNAAGGFGGGVAGCATGRLFIFGDGTSGAAIYSNGADGKHVSGDGSEKHEDHTYAYDNATFMSAG